MKNYQGYKTLSDYQKNSAKIITTNSGLPDIYNRVVILSTLNTGSDPYKNNIIEISCMEMMGGKLTGREFDAYLRPRYSINEVTKQNTNLNNNFYEDFFKNVYSSDKDVLKQFKNFVNISKIITFNSKKEFIFINNELKYNGIPTYQKIRFYSLIDIFKYIFPSSNTEILSLYQVSKFLEIRLPQEKKLHTSKSDCFIIAKIVSKLYDIINIPQKSIELKNGIIPIDKTEQINLNNININNDKVCHINMPCDLSNQNIDKKSYKFKENKISDFANVNFYSFFKWIICFYVIKKNNSNKITYVYNIYKKYISEESLFFIILQTKEIFETNFFSNLK